MIHSKAIANPWKALTSTSVFIFFALTFAVPSGYSYGAVLLLLTSIGYLLSRPRPRLSSEDEALSHLLLAFFLVSLLAFLIHRNELETLDQSSRYLLFIPVLFLMIENPPSERAVWSGLVLGTVSALGLALWQRYMQGNPRPDGFMTSAIPFGNLALTAGILCLAGVFWANTQYRAWAWKISLHIGFLAGLYVSLLSGSRGGWLAIPAVFVIFLVAFLRKRRTLKTIVFGFLLLLTMLIAAGMSMQDEVRSRYEAAAIEIDDYITHDNAATSVGVRLEAWRTAIMGIAEKPILGWSYKDYDARLAELVAGKEANISVTTLANTHNNFLEVWLHQGLLGLISILALFIVPFRFFCRRLRSSSEVIQAFAVGGACLVACFFIFGLTQVILGRNNGTVFFGLTLVIFWGCLRNGNNVLVSTPPATINSDIR